MADNLNYTGYIVKEETVSVFNSYVIKNTFVLHVDHPFPGYYGQSIIDVSTPRGILFITKNEESWERCIRLQAKINKYLELSVNFSKAKVQIQNNTYFGFRVKGIATYDDIYVLQRALQDEGIVFMKKKRIGKEATALITLKKFFSLEQIEEGIYRSKTSDMTYVTIPHQITWELFRRHTTIVKRNVSDTSYDVVMGAMYINYNIVDMLRIFKPNIKIDLLREIKQEYEKQIKMIDAQ